MLYKNYIYKMTCLVFCTFLLTFQAAIGQQKEKLLNEGDFPCSSEPLTAAELENYRQWAKLEQAQSEVELRTVVTQDVPVVFHIVRNSSGAGVTVEQVTQALEIANEKFADSGIQLYQCSSPNIIISNEWYNTTFVFEWENNCDADTPEYDFDATYHIPNVINIYCVRTNGWSWASLPSHRTSRCFDWVVFNQGHVNSSWLLAHELGHYFGLLHTFQGNDENVTRHPFHTCYNCLTEGDLLCDTPADHHVSSEWSAGCDPDNKYDACGVLLVPNGLNLMSYSNSTCSGEDKYFTAGQNNRMNFYLETQRSYLSCGHDCIASYNLTGTQTTSKTYRAWDFIHSSATLYPEITSIYQAGDHIDLLPGFLAPKGVNFTARIAACADDFGISGLANNTESVEENLPQTPDVGNLAQGTIFKAYPSPFWDKLSVEFSVEKQQQVNIELFDIAGRLIKHLEIDTPEMGSQQVVEINTNTLRAGVYFVVLKSNGIVQTLKVVKS